MEIESPTTDRQACNRLAEFLQIRLEDLTDYQTGTTVNVGLVKGGTRSNVVAEHACSGLDRQTAGACRPPPVSA